MGVIKIISKLDVLEGDLNLNQLSYVNDSSYPFKYTINRHYYSENTVISSYICSDKELSFSISTMNSYYDFVSVTSTSPATIKCFNTKMDVTEGKQLSFTGIKEVTLVTKDTDIKIRNSLTGINMTIEKIGAWNNKEYEKPEFSYSINVDNGVTYKILEKINNETTNEITKTNNSENVFEINSWDTMKYGIYNISIDVMIDDIFKCNLYHKFEKYKSKVQHIPTNSNLKQVILHNKELEKEIDYQNFRLSEKLKEKGIEVVENKSLSSLIDNVGEIKQMPFSNTKVNYSLIPGDRYSYIRGYFVLNNVLYILSSANASSGIIEISSTDLITGEIILSRDASMSLPHLDSRNQVLGNSVSDKSWVSCYVSSSTTYSYSVCTFDNGSIVFNNLDFGGIASSPRPRTGTMIDGKLYFLTLNNAYNKVNAVTYDLNAKTQTILNSISINAQTRYVFGTDHVDNLYLFVNGSTSTNYNKFEIYKYSISLNEITLLHSGDIDGSLIEIEQGLGGGCIKVVKDELFIFSRFLRDKPGLVFNLKTKEIKKINPVYAYKSLIEYYDNADLTINVSTQKNSQYDGVSFIVDVK